MRVHAINTGMMGVKRRYVAAKGRMRLVRFASALLDHQWRDVPIFVWVIEHPEGVIVIDAGETAQVQRPDFFPPIQRPYWKSQYRFIVRPEDEIGPQLRARGIAPADVRWLVLTHTHFDHTDALYHFPNTEVIVSQREWNDAQNLRLMHFAFPSKWPKSLRVREIDYPPEPYGTFRYSFPLTKAGDVHIVPTPGHTMGHQSVILDEGDHSVFFGGDTSFDLPSLLNGTLDAPATNSHVTLRTREQILALAHDQPLVYLTTHDPETLARLKARTLLVPRHQPTPAGAFAGVR